MTDPSKNMEKPPRLNCQITEALEEGIRELAVVMTNKRGRSVPESDAARLLLARGIALGKALAELGDGPHRAGTIMQAFAMIEARAVEIAGASR